MINVSSELVQAFVAGAQKVVTDHYKEKYPDFAIPEIRAEEGQKYIRVLKNEQTYCFIAKEDGKTKALGEVREGDVLKAATFRGPAKGARSNLFDASGGASACEWHGVRYLR